MEVDSLGGKSGNWGGSLLTQEDSGMRACWTFLTHEFSNSGTARTAGGSSWWSSFCSSADLGLGDSRGNQSGCGLGRWWDGDDLPALPADAEEEGDASTGSGK